jgi:hypothetical protein
VPVGDVKREGVFVERPHEDVARPADRHRAQDVGEVVPPPHAVVGAGHPQRVEKGGDADEQRQSGVEVDAERPPQHCRHDRHPQ